MSVNTSGKANLACQKANCRSAMEIGLVSSSVSTMHAAPGMIVLPILRLGRNTRKLASWFHRSQMRSSNCFAVALPGSSAPKLTALSKPFKVGGSTPVLQGNRAEAARHVPTVSQSRGSASRSGSESSCSRSSRLTKSRPPIILTGRYFLTRARIFFLDTGRYSLWMSSMFRYFRFKVIVSILIDLL